jgi:hypothetical protein
MTLIETVTTAFLVVLAWDLVKWLFRIDGE